MTQEHPIRPPNELFKQWEDDILNERDNVDHVLDCALRNGFQAGADQELEACCDTLQRHAHWDLAVCELMADRRPKPPSLKEQALQALYRFDDTEGHEGLTPEQIAEDFVLIRRALESLPD